jgi:hypothetical protein
LVLMLVWKSQWIIYIEEEMSLRLRGWWHRIWSRKAAQLVSLLLEQKLVTTGGGGCKHRILRLSLLSQHWIPY